MTRRLSPLSWFHAGLAAVLCTAAAWTVQPASAAPDDGTPPAVAGVQAAPQAAAAPAPAATPLEELSARRQAERNDGEYTLGEGDVLSIKAFDLDEMNQKVRIDGEGAITLPLLNTVPVAGRTVSDVQKDLTGRLGQFMYSPHVTIFVEEYRSQQVAVQGAVEKPGVVNQMTRSSTVREALAAAGGLTGQAGSRIYLLPGEHRKRPEGGREAGLLDAEAHPADEPTLADAVMIDTREMDPETQRRFYDLPVRGGDVIMVPNQGRFIAEGWVGKPGIYQLNPGLTLRGAIAVAGGLTFPAKPTHVQICTPGANGETEVRELNYASIVSLKSPDVFLRDGDVVHVDYSAFKVVPWAFYKLVSDLLHLGIGTKFAP